MNSYKENKKCKEGTKVQCCALVALGTKRAQGLKCISSLAPSKKNKVLCRAASKPLKSVKTYVSTFCRKVLDPNHRRKMQKQTIISSLVSHKYHVGYGPNHHAPWGWRRSMITWNVTGMSLCSVHTILGFKYKVYNNKMQDGNIILHIGVNTTIRGCFLSPHRSIASQKVMKAQNGSSGRQQLRSICGWW